MIVKYTVTIGFPGAEIEGEIEIDDRDLEGLTDKERNEKITQIVWEDGLQYVDMPWEVISE